MALGIMVAVVFILAATLTLLPAVLGASSARRSTTLSLPWVHSGEHRSPRFAALGRAALGAPARSTACRALLVLLALAAPVLGLKTGMPSIKVVPTGDSSRIGYTQVQPRSGPARPARCRSSPRQRDAAARRPRPPRPTRASPP